MLRSRANEVPELVLRLASRSKRQVDAARARLSLFGAQAVDELVACLEGDDDRIRARAMPLLGLIQDGRAREPLVAMLLDPNPRLRRIAASSLGRFPSGDATCALVRAIGRDRSELVRVAAVQALVDHHNAGREAALAALLDVLLDRELSSRLRLAALECLHNLRPQQRRGLMRRLERDPDPLVRERVEAVARESTDHDDRARPAHVRALLENLSSADYATWHQALSRLGHCGAAAVGPLIEEMRSRAHDPEFCIRGGMALKAMGYRKARAVVAALETLEEPLPLQVLVDVIGAWGEKSLIYGLKGLIERLARLRSRRNGDGAGNGGDLLERVRAKAHLELARLGSRVAVEDLRHQLEEPGGRLEPESLSAVERIGKREEIAALLRAFSEEDPGSRRRVGEAVRAIMRRERIRRNDRRLARLPGEQRHALQAILAPPRA